MRQRSAWRTVGVPCSLFLFLFYLAVFFAPRLNPPAPQRYMYHLEKDAVGRAIVTSQSRSTGRTMFQIRPHHLEFSSTNGSIDVSVALFDEKEPHGNVQHMLDSTGISRLNKMPEKVIAHASGQAGNISLHTWPYGRVSYVVFMRAEETSDVSLIVKYGP